MEHALVDWLSDFVEGIWEWDRAKLALIVDLTFGLLDWLFGRVLGR